MINKLNNQNFESWILSIIDSKTRKRYLFYDFEDDIINLLKDYYSNNYLTFLESKYFLWCFEESDVFYNPDISKLGSIGYSDLVTARTEGKDFIVLIPKMNANQIDLLPSDSSKGTSETIENSIYRFAEYVLDSKFRNQLNEVEVFSLGEMQNLLFQKFPNDLFQFFSKETNNKEDIFKFYGILNSFENLLLGKNGKPVKTIFESRYRILFIQKIKEILTNFSISYLEEKLIEKNVANVELVIREFWLEPYDLARDLGNHIDLVFFRKTEYYSNLIDVNEWIRALNDDDEIELKSQIEYEQKSELDRYSVIFNDNTFKSDFNLDNSIYIPNISNKDSFEVFLSNQENADWYIENQLKELNDNLLRIDLNCQGNILTPVVAQKKEDKRSIILALYSSINVVENFTDFAFGLRNDKGKLISLKETTSDIFGDINRFYEIYHEFKNLAILSSNNQFDKDDFNFLEEPIFYKFKKKKNELDSNSNLYLNLRFLNDAGEVIYTSFCNQELTDLRLNYKNQIDFNTLNEEDGTFYDKKIIIDEISDGYLFFTVKNENFLKLIAIEVITENLLQQDLIVGNSFLKLKALNDSSNKLKKITIASKGNNEVNQYYFGEKYEEKSTYLPTIFNDFKSNMVEIDLTQSNNCPVIGNEYLKVPATEFRPDKFFFESFYLSNPQMIAYVTNREKIKLELLRILGNSFDELDFSKLTSDLKTLIQKQLLIYQNIIDESNIIGQFIDTYFIVENDENNILNDVPLAMFFSPLHPLLLNQLISKSELLNNTLNSFGTKKTGRITPTINSISQSIDLNILSHWIIKSSKTDDTIIFHQLNTDSLLFTGYINSDFGFKPNNLSGFLKHLEINCNESDGFLSYSQIQSALSKSFEYLSKKPEFNICLKGELADKDTNNAIFDWIDKTQKQLKEDIGNYQIIINIYDCRNSKVEPFPASNEVSYFKNDLGLNFNWFTIEDTNELEIDLTIVTSQKSNKSILNQRDHNLLSNNFYYHNLIAFRLNKKNHRSLLSDIIFQNNNCISQLDCVLNKLNETFSNLLNGKNRQIQHNLIGATFNNTQLLAISSQISSSQILQEINSGKSLWEFSISDHSFQDSGRGDYYLLADEQKDYVDRFYQFLREINQNVNDIIFQKFINYSKEIGLFQLRNLLSNSNFLKEFIACVTARKLLDCKIKNKNIFVIPYDLFQPRLRKIKDEINPKYSTEGTQFPDFILIEFFKDEFNVNTIDLRLIEIKYREKDLTRKEIGAILKDQTERIKEIFHNLNLFRERFDDTNIWKHTLSILLSEMYSYYLDNNSSNNNNSEIFNQIINSDYKFRINDSLLIAIDGSDKFEFGQIKEGIFYKIPRNAIHQIFDCDSSINSNFGRMYDSMLREDTSYKFMEKNIDYLNNQGEQGTNKEKLTLEISEVHLIPSEENHESNFQKPNAAETESKSSNDELITLEKSDDVNKQEEKSNETKKVDVLPYQPEVNSTLIAKPKISLGLNVDNGKNVEFNPVTMIPKKLANQHLLIVGKSGAGKSQTTSSILYELSREDIPFLILDFQGEYISSVLTNSNDQSFAEATNAMTLDPSYGMDINPLELSLDGNTGQKIGYMSNVYQVSSILKQIFGLGDIQNPVLKDAIKRAYQEKGFSVNDRNTWNNEAPQFQDIWSILEFMEQTEGANVRNLKYRIEPLFENNIFVSNGQGTSINNVLNRNSIIDLSKLHTPELMKSVARFVLQAVYNRMIAEGPSKRIKLYVVIDEAHKLSYDQTLTDLIREARKYGVGFILASQSVRDFATVVFENMGTKIALQLEGDDAKYMAENFGATDKTSKEAVLSMLPTQKPLRALIRNNHYEPFVQVDIKPFYEK
jgi:hypothetical protein